DQFGLSFEMDDAAKNLLRSSNIDLEKRNADGRWILPVPGTFVIDQSGHIAYAHVDADYRNRAEPQEIVAICRALAIADMHIRRSSVAAGRTCLLPLLARKRPPARKP